MSNEKETKLGALERLQQEAEKELETVLKNSERELGELNQSTAKAREVAKDDYELAKIHNHYEWEIWQIQKGQAEASREIKRKFFEKVKALL